MRGSNPAADDELSPGRWWRFRERTRSGASLADPAGSALGYRSDQRVATARSLRPLSSYYRQQPRAIQKRTCADHPAAHNEEFSIAHSGG